MAENEVAAARRRIMTGPGGFTLIELMVVVAIVGILTGIAVFMYTRYVKTARVSQVRAVLGEFRLKEEQHYVENNAYLATGVDEDDVFPVPSADAPTSIAGAPAAWQTLHVKLGDSAVWCGFVVITGDGGDATNIGPTALAMGMTAPDEDWFYVLADCPFDGKKYLISSASDAMIVR